MVYGCTTDIQVSPENMGKMFPEVEEVCDISNSLGVDLHIALHSNGKPSPDANVSIFGPETFYLNNSLERSVKSLKLTEIIQGDLFALYNSCNGGNKQERSMKIGDYLEFNLTNAVPSYIELAFHDYEEDENWMLSYFDEIALTISKSIKKYVEESIS